jgi:hypothetical protein
MCNLDLGGRGINVVHDISSYFCNYICIYAKYFQNPLNYDEL